LARWRHALALVLNDERLMAQVRASIDYTLTTPQVTATGPKNLKIPKAISIAGRRMCLSRPGSPGRCTTYSRQPGERRHSRGAPETLPWRHPPTERPPETSQHRTILWTYARTGDPRLVAWQERLEEYLTVANDPAAWRLSPLASMPPRPSMPRLHLR